MSDSDNIRKNPKTGEHEVVCNRQRDGYGCPTPVVPDDDFVCPNNHPADVLRPHQEKFEKDKKEFDQKYQEKNESQKNYADVFKQLEKEGKIPNKRKAAKQAHDQEIEKHKARERAKKS